jgi:hypothetical protein
MAVQFKTELPKTNFAQSPPHNFQGRELLGDKEYSLAAI